MKKLILISIFFSLTLNLFAEEAIPLSGLGIYQNTREGHSQFLSEKKEAEVASLYYKTSVDFKKIEAVMADKKLNRCASKIISNIEEELNIDKNNDVELAILGLRLNNTIDDVAADILIKTNNLKHFTLPANSLGQSDLTEEEEKTAMTIFRKQKSVLNDSSLCIEDSYRDLVSQLFQSSPKFIKNLKSLNRAAFKNDYLTKNTYKDFEVMRIKKVHEWPLTLIDYSEKLQAIAATFPNRPIETADLVSTLKARQKTSLRENLYNKYNSNQILLLANILKKLRNRLESKSVTININYDEGESEILNLSPMEKFRFILKLLRKELADLNNGSLLDGKTASYLDLITAGYEVGFISSADINQFASLQEIWNPTKTPKEKAMFWIKNFGGVASVLLPQPFGFISVMVIMIIDEQIKASPVDSNSDFNLF